MEYAMDLSCRKNPGFKVTNKKHANASVSAL